MSALEETLITFERGGELLSLHHTTIRQRKGGTAELTHVRGFGRAVKLIESEVLALRRRKIEESREHQQEMKSLIRLAS